MANLFGKRATIWRKKAMRATSKFSSILKNINRLKMLLGCSESGYVFFGERERRFSNSGVSTWSWMVKFDPFNLGDLTSCFWQFVSMNALFLPSSGSTGLPERAGTSTSKLAERNIANPFWHWRSVNTSSPYTSNIFFPVWTAFLSFW